jgi:hypothetical protein
MLWYHILWLSVLFLVICDAEEPKKGPDSDEPIRLSTAKSTTELKEEAEAQPVPPQRTEDKAVGEETTDLKRRIEALELLVAEQENRRAQMKKVVGFVEKRTMSTISNLRKKLAQGAPETDEECSYDYVLGRCVPACDCKLQPKLGDYSLSRACRLVESDIRSDGNELAPPPCDPSSISMTPWVIRLSKYIMRMINKVVDHIKTHAPPTDDECVFKLPGFSCQPSDACVFAFQFGDYSLHRACRFKDASDDSDDEITGGDSDPLRSDSGGTEDRVSPHPGHAHTENL